MGTVVVVIGFIVAFAFVFFGIDDLFVDVFALFKRAKPEQLDLKGLERKPPKMQAIIIACWHEDAVIESVVDNLVASIQYPADQYRVFIGTYPNDPATQAAADRLCARHDNVVKLVNATEGPTSKADMLNYGFTAIRAYEKAHTLQFAGVTIHDSEDVVHPFELRATNDLLDDHEALQYPVFPLMRLPRLRTFFRTLTSGTYADEFAEHHYRTMVMRDSLAFVPSAGTGFVLRRDVFEAFEGEDLLPDDCLTEDYKLSLQLAFKGIKVHYVLERLPRIDESRDSSWDHIATRSIFPSTFKTAVRQKSRWVYGITMQSASLKDVFGRNNLTVLERIFLYKDLKAKFSNFVLVPGYLVFVYFVCQLIWPDLPVMYPTCTPGWWLCIMLLLMMIERQVLRGKALLHIYGKRQMALACLLPPLFPIRLIWGNIINICATAKAWWQKATLRRTNRKTESESDVQEAAPSVDPLDAVLDDENIPVKPEWKKTDHEFLPTEVLRRYHRLLGDYLLLFESVDATDLKEALKASQEEKKPLGSYLIENSEATPDQVASAVAALDCTVALGTACEDGTPLRLSPCTGCNIREWQTLHALPLLHTAEGWVAAFPQDEASSMSRVHEGAVFPVVAVESAIDAGLNETSRTAIDGSEEVASLVDEGIITLAQAGLVVGYALNLQARCRTVMDTMGIAL